MVNEQLYICMQKHIQHNKDEQTQFFRKIYLSLYWKGCVWEVSWRLNKDCNILTPSSSGYSSASFSFSWAAQPGAWGLSLSAESWFPQLDLEHWLQALNSNCLTSYLTRVISLFYAHSIQPVNCQGYLLISSTGCTCYLHRRISHLTAWPDRRSICNNHPIIILQNSTCGIFFTSVSISLTHTFYWIIFLDNNTEKRTQKEITWTTAKHNLT